MMQQKTDFSFFAAFEKEFEELNHRKHEADARILAATCTILAISGHRASNLISFA